MDRIWVQGVVKNGQVVLDAPLGVPDDTVVTVTDDTVPATNREIVLTDDDFMEFTDFFTGKRPPAEWAEFAARIRGSKEAA